MTGARDILKFCSDKKRFPLLLAVLLFIWLMWLSGMLELWTLSEEYGHGLMVLGLLLYILYRRRETLVIEAIRYPQLALPVALLATVFVISGVASGISVISMYGFMAFAIAAILVVGGTKLLKKVLAPLAVIWLLIPLPNPYGPMLTSGLQLISSQLGVWFIRALGGAVYQEGNVIDMGGLQLLVAEACSGLRYLFPLMSLGAILGFMLHAPLWLRILVFVVTIPITIVLNSLRIALTGLVADHWGLVYTQGFLHFFEGWIVFIVATLLLLATLWVVLRLVMPEKSIRDVLQFDAPVSVGATSSHSIQSSLDRNGLKWIVAAMLVFTVLMGSVLKLRTEQPPHRVSFDHFPTSFGDWRSHEFRLPEETENVASATEYYFGDFTSQTDGVVNVYVSFYATQLNGQIPHSPKVCIPGGGWQIENIRKVTLQNRNGEHFLVNRLVISKGDHKQLAYYWLKQGDRMYSQEWVARLDLIRSSILKRRTDGALIRLVTEIKPEDSEQTADQRLSKFSPLLLNKLPEYIPD